MNKSPSGSICPYYYMGGELHPLKYGGYFKDKDKLYHVMNAEETFILQSSGLKNRRIWIDLYETELDEDVANALALHIKAIEHKIFKICFVGCRFTERIRLKRAIRKNCIGIYKQMEFFSDPEKAKQWLLNEENICE